MGRLFHHERHGAQFRRNNGALHGFGMGQKPIAPDVGQPFGPQGGGEADAQGFHLSLIHISLL